MNTASGIQANAAAQGRCIMDQSDSRGNPAAEPENVTAEITTATSGRGALSWLRSIMAGVLIGITVLLLVLRFGLTAIESHRPEVEHWVSGLLQRPVSIDSLRAYWRGWSPELEIHGLKLHRVDDTDASGEPAITFDQVRISVDPVESVKSRRLLAHAVIIEGAALTVKRVQDGSIFIAGMQPSDDAKHTEMQEDLARWILKEGTLVFDSTTVSWIDASRGNAPILLTSARVELSNTHDKHHLSGSFRIPGISAERIQFALDATGDLSTSTWSGRMALNANGVRASQFGALFETGGKWVSGGGSDVSILADWKHGTIERAQMRIRADGLMLSDMLGGLRVHGGTAEVDIGRLENGWSADVLLRGVHTSEGRWRTSRGALNYLVDANGGGPRLVGSFEYARLADLASLLQTRLRKIDFASAVFETYRPSAELSNLVFSTGLGEKPADSLVLAADFNKFSAVVGPAFPALSDYSGRIEIDGDAGVVSMNRGTLDFALAGVFQGRFLLATEGGRIAWRREVEGSRLDVYDVGFSAARLGGRLSGFARWDGNASGPLLNVVASLSSDDVGELKRYIPEGVLKPKLVDWLRRAVRGGRLTEGRLLLHGRMANIPFDNEDGVLQGRFAFEDGELEYKSGWPELSGLSGELRVRGRRLDGTIMDGRIFDSRIDTASIAIDRLGEGVPVLQIRGSGSGTAAEGLRFLNESPLKQRFSDHLSDIVVRGDIDLSLDIETPLGEPGIHLDGRVALKNNGLNFRNLKSGIEGIKGTLLFNHQGARAKSIDAVYLGRPVTLSLMTRPKAPHDTRINISGRADGKFIGKHLSNSGLLDVAGEPAPLWLKHLDGETAWLATIDVPAAGQSSRIQLESSLEGMRIDLPYPIGKDVDASRPLAISMQARDSKRRDVRIRYGEDTRAALQIELLDGNQSIRRGELRFGGADAIVPKGEGIYVAGFLPQLVAGDWVQAWNSSFADSIPEPRPENGLRQVALDVDRLGLLGSTFENVQIRAAKDGDGSWTTRFFGDGLKGTVRLLAAADDSPLLATFDEVHYRSSAAEDATRISDPREIPPIRLMIDRFIFNGRDLGVVKVSTTPTAAGLNFGDISIAARGFEARSNGFWNVEDGKQRSEFSVSLHSNSLSEFLESMGFEGDNASEGATDIFLNARWQASPMEFDLRKLKGTLHFRSVNGRLLEVERGATERIFGLLSVTALPRRLILDFTDLFETGLSYESIDGSFNLENGEAYTNNVVMETNTARVEIAGRTGLVTEDYDQTMTVTPKLTSSLPLAPLWLMEKAFNRELFGDVFSAQYTITGSWADPKVEPITVKSNVEERG